MKKLILRQNIIDTIKQDPLLFGKLAYILDVNAMSLPRILNTNSLRLTEASVIQLLKDHLKITDDSELLTEASEVSTA